MSELLALIALVISVISLTFAAWCHGFEAGKKFQLFQVQSWSINQARIHNLRSVEQTEESE